MQDKTVLSECREENPNPENPNATELPPRKLPEAGEGGVQLAGNGWRRTRRAGLMTKRLMEVGSKAR